jgi:preprotein translocase subunit SecA
LIGTVSIEKSEALSAAGQTRHQTPGAERQASQTRGGDHRPGGPVGRRNDRHEHGRRGTDIVSGGNPETMAWARLQDKYATRLDVPTRRVGRLVAKIEEEEGMREAQGEHAKAIGGCT